MTELRTVSEWTKAQRELLDLERGAERLQLTDKIESLSAKECEDAGLSLLSMIIDGTTNALFGRSCLSLVRSDKSNLLKAFKVGDEVVMYCPKLRNTPEFVLVECIVSKVLPASLEVICDEVDESLFDLSIRVDARASDGTYSKYLAVLNDLESSRLPLVSLLFPGDGTQPLSLRCGDARDGASPLPREVQLINPRLNSSQTKAVMSSLETKRISVIHGPPGTGKTSTVVEIIQQAALLRRSVLVCAPSNVAVDNVLERLILANESISDDRVKGARARLRLVRLGHPARVSQRSARYCLDSLIAEDDGTDIVADVRCEIDGLQREMLRCRKKDKSRRREIQSEVRILRKEARKREDAVVKGIMKGADVVVCTCVTAGSRLLRDVTFDILIIDEAAQALEVSCWIPLLLSRRVVLVGDHHQLPPTVKSAAAAARGLATTLFERVINNEVFEKEGLVHLLDTQYRMNASICDWTSRHIYGGRLLSHSSVAQRTIADIGAEGSRALPSGAPEGKSAESSEPSCEFGDAFPVLLLLDTAGSEMYEDSCGEGSRSNAGEAQVVLRHVLHLLDAMKVQPHDIGVITPYNGQLGVLRQLFATESETDPRLSLVDMKTIDGYQGGEKECVVISLTRSNLKKEVGFLGDKRRINVAVTRAKVHLAVVCDADTCASDPFISVLLDHISAVGVHNSVFEVSYLAPCVSDGTFSGSGSGSSASKATPGGRKGDGQSAHSSKQATLKQDSSAKAAKRIGGLGNTTGQSGRPPSTAASVVVNYPLELERILEEFASGTVGEEEGVAELMCTADSGGTEVIGIKILRVQPAVASDTAKSSAARMHPTATLLRFPASLDSYCRLLVHELATSRSLFHRSVGAPPHRCIEVSSLPFEEEVCVPPPQVPDSAAMLCEEVDARLMDGQIEEEIDGQMDGHGGEEQQPEVEAESAAVTAPPSESALDLEDIRRIRAAKYASSKAPPKKGKAPPVPKAKKESKGPEADEASSLEEAIRENQMRARDIQYRVGSTPFPNPVSVDNMRKAALRKVIQEAEGLRRVAIDPAQPVTKAKRAPKVLKKPPT